MESFEDKQIISELLDIYGGLLTERQKTFIQLHYNDDLSYGEIAESEDISRQAVHDTIQHGKKSLFKFEKELKLNEHNTNKSSESSSISSSKDIPLDQIKNIVNDLCKLVQDDIMYDTGKLKSKVYQLRDLFADKK